jgi:hypothetical protein
MQDQISSPATVRLAAPPRTTRLALLATTFLATFGCRIWGVTAYSLVLRDQYRDWEIVQGTFGSLPLPGPANARPRLHHRPRVLLGGRIDRAAAWVAVIDENGDVTYQDASGA